MYLPYTKQTTRQRALREICGGHLLSQVPLLHKEHSVLQTKQETLTSFKGPILY